MSCLPFKMTIFRSKENKMQINNESNIPRGLLKMAGDRDLITTPEFAKVFNVASQTIRKNHSADGSVFGIKPIKLGHKLLWPVDQIANKMKEMI